MIVRLLATAFLLLLLLLPTFGWAAIAVVSHTEATATENVSSVSFSVTVPAGADRVMILESAVRREASGTAFNISSVTFNGSESFTHIRRDNRPNSTASANQTELWYLVAPSVTTANVVVTYAGVNQSAIGVSATLFTGVSQSSPIDSHAGSAGTSTAPSAIVTTVADNAAIIDIVMGRSDTGLTVGAGQTMRSDRIVGSALDGVGVSTVVPKTPAGAETMDWTQADAFGWATSTASLTPSGGTDPNPVVNGQVTLTWTNGTDPGNPSSGIFNTSIRRCIGALCACATAGPGIGSVSFPQTTFVDTAVLPDTTYGFCAFHTDGVGLPSINSGIVYKTTSATPPDALPTITSAATDATGSTLGYGPVTPTQIEVNTFTSNGVVSSVIHEMSDFPGGRFTQTWIDGLQGVCFIPISATGIKNTDPSGYQCDDLTTIVDPFDTTPPTLSGCQPTTDLPAGTTEWNFSCNANKPGTAKWDTGDVAYDSMANTMALNSLTFSATKTGLTNGISTPIYIRSAITDLDDVVHPATTSTVVTINVASSTADTTPPGDVANAAGTLIGNAVTLTWDDALDAVKYQVYQAEGACSTYAPAGSPITTTSTQLSLSFSTVYCWKIKALDVVNNLSTNFSNVVTKTTLAQPDIEAPSDLEGLRVDVFTNSVRASWMNGTDNIGPVSVNLEYCQAEVGQTDCANFNVTVSKIGQSFLTLNLSPGRWYCFRGKNADGAGNVSVNYSAAVCAQTATTGLGAPRVEIPFGVTRLPLALPRLPNAIQRIPVP